MCDVAPLVRGVDSSLHRAALMGRTNGVTSFLFLRARSTDACARVCACAVVEHLIASTGKADLPALINALGSNGQSALHKAAFNGHDRIVELLIGNGAALDMRDNERALPLHKAAAGGHLSAVKACVGPEALGLLSATDAENGTALRLAAAHGHLETVRVRIGCAAHCCCPSCVDSCDARKQFLLSAMKREAIASQLAAVDVSGSLACRFAAHIVVTGATQSTASSCGEER